MMRKRFFLYIVLPSILAVGLFLLSIFLFILPSSEKNIMKEKKNMISELTNTVCSLIDEYNEEVAAGNMSMEAAQSLAIDRVSRIRYGEEQKDYFWIIDHGPNMIMHPYRPELNATRLDEYRDPNGKALFVESVQLVEAQSSGYIDYMWQWKDDSTRIVPKLSYVRAFQAWDWIVGTGIYLEDVREDIRVLKVRLLRIVLLITLLLSILLAVIIRQSLQIERKRGEAEQKLRLSREKYKSLVEASTEGTLMFSEGRFIFSNLKFTALSGYSPDNLAQMKPRDILELDWQELIGEFRDPKRSLTRDTLLLCREGEKKEVVVSVSKVNQGGVPAYIIILKEITSLQRLDKDFGKLSDELRSALLLLDPGERSLEEEVNRSQTVSELLRIYQRLPVRVKALSDSGANTGIITHAITRLADAITIRVIGMAEEELGTPPCNYTFMVLGSEGRGEQTLATDQDNAIVFEDTGNEKAKAYFEKLGSMVSDTLNKVGYRYCRGEIMASNPKWVQPLGKWKDYYTKWITDGNPADILEAGIFFDLRSLKGKGELVSELRDHIHKVSDQQAVFFYHMAQAVLKFRAPVSELSALIKGKEDAEIDVKKVLLPLTAFVRLYSVRQKLPINNTTHRITQLQEAGVIRDLFATELAESLEFLTRIRIRIQLDRILKSEEPDNILRGNLLSELELNILKKIFEYISGMQTRISAEFRGIGS